MTIPLPFGGNRPRRAFTLVEIMIASGLVAMLGGAMIYCNLFGLAMAVRQQIYISASSDSARAIGEMMNDIRSGVAVEVGNINTNALNINGGFVQTNGTQNGTALMVYELSNGPPWYLYYYYAQSNRLVRTNYYGTNSGDYKVIAANEITNDGINAIFTLVNPNTGVAWTAPPATAPVAVYLSFIKLQNPEIAIGQSNIVDIYQITTTIMPRMRD